MTHRLNSYFRNFVNTNHSSQQYFTYFILTFDAPAPKYIIYVNFPRTRNIYPHVGHSLAQRGRKIVCESAKKGGEPREIYRVSAICINKFSKLRVNGHGSAGRGRSNAYIYVYVCEVRDMGESSRGPKVSIIRVCTYGIGDGK